MDDYPQQKLAKPPLRIPKPHTLPGRFFVLTWDKMIEKFIVFLDDEENSSFKLDSIQDAMLQMKMWGLGDFGNQCIDQAREFGSVQGIPSQKRCINLFDRKPQRRMVFHEEGSYVGSLPPL